MVKKQNVSRETSTSTPLPAPIPDEKINPSDIMAKEDIKKVKVTGGWVVMTEDDVIEHQKSGKLIGYDPEKKQGLLKEGN